MLPVLCGLLNLVFFFFFFLINGFFFFFKQKTAYEMLRSLVGSEMCIRDSCWPPSQRWTENNDWSSPCLLYTSDAADDLTRVDLGGRRIIKKKKKKKKK